MWFSTIFICTICICLTLALYCWVCTVSLTCFLRASNAALMVWTRVLSRALARSRLVCWIALTSGIRPGSSALIPTRFLGDSWQQRTREAQIIELIKSRWTFVFLFHWTKQQDSRIANRCFHMPLGYRRQQFIIVTKPLVQYNQPLDNLYWATVNDVFQGAKDWLMSLTLFGALNKKSTAICLNQ